MYSVEYLPSAKRDMEEIVSYVANRLGSPQAARRLAEELVDAAESLATMPYRRRVYVPVRQLKREYRALRAGSYLMFYWIEEERRTVVIARVVYGKSDVLARLQI